MSGIIGVAELVDVCSQIFLCSFVLVFELCPLNPQFNLNFCTVAAIPTDNKYRSQQLQKWCAYVMSMMYSVNVKHVLSILADGDVRHRFVSIHLAHTFSS